MRAECNWTKILPAGCWPAIFCVLDIASNEALDVVGGLAGIGIRSRWRAHGLVCNSKIAVLWLSGLVFNGHCGAEVA